MRRVLIVFSFACIGIAAAACWAQSQSQHVFMVTAYRANPGQEAAYNQALNERARPVMDELVRRGVIESYLFLYQPEGTGENTHIVIIEFSSRAGIEALDAEEGRVAEEIFGQPYDEWVSVFPPLRERLWSQVYVSP
jgi:hypothetical protein